MDDDHLEAALKEAQLGDTIAFGRVYDAFFGRVFGLCRKMLGSQAAAEDATSEVFERAFHALDQYDRDRPFDRWILAIASRHCLNRLRRERLEKQLFQEPVEAPASPAASSPWVALQTREERRMLIKAIDTLPDNYRLPLILKYYGDLSYDEIAEQLDTTRNNVAVLLHRAKRELRRTVSAFRKDEP